MLPQASRVLQRWAGLPRLQVLQHWAGLPCLQELQHWAGLPRPQELQHWAGLPRLQVRRAELSCRCTSCKLCEHMRAL